MTQKRCKKCGEFKPLMQFRSHSSAKCGYESMCMDCRATKQIVSTKQIVGPKQCGGCYVSMKRPHLGGWLCKDCSPAVTSSCDKCDVCSHVDRCKERLSLDLWLVCERPSKGDVIRALIKLRSSNGHGELIVDLLEHYGNVG